MTNDAVRRYANERMGGACCHIADSNVPHGFCMRADIPGWKDDEQLKSFIILLPCRRWGRGTWILYQKKTWGEGLWHNQAYTMTEDVVIHRLGPTSLTMTWHLDPVSEKWGGMGDVVIVGSWCHGGPGVSRCHVVVFQPWVNNVSHWVLYHFLPTKGKLPDTILSASGPGEIRGIHHSLSSVSFSCALPHSGDILLFSVLVGRYSRSLSSP